MKAVVFDIGNVLIGWDPYRLYRDLLPDDAAIAAFLDEVGFHDWNLEFDRGVRLSEGVASKSAEFPHRRDLLAAFAARWEETLTGVMEESLEILRALQASQVPLYAITNFSAETWPIATARYPFLTTVFRDVVVSGHEGIVKPEAQIYQILLERNGLAAQDCVFIDDSAANVAGARAIGMDAIHFTKPAALAAALGTRGLL